MSTTTTIFSLELGASAEGRTGCVESSLSKRAAGRLLADVVAAIGSIDIVLGEIDR